MTASVTQKYFKDTPDLSEYLRRLHNDPVASGGYGIVYKCSLRDGNDSSLVVAVKSFRYEIPLNSEPEPKFSKTLRREIKVWRELRHPNIVPLLGIAYGFGSAISTVSPWICGGPLHAYLDARDAGLNLSDRFGLLEGVAAGLDYLHSFPVVHGDLSSGNILIDDDGKARLSDFGLCTVVGGLSGGSSFGWATRRPGAIPWAAPELVLPPDTVQPCTASDIFSFGCIMLQILSGQIPWGKMNVCEIILALSRGKHAPRLEHRPICQRDWDFIQRCWSSADVRPTVGDVVNFISPVLASLREDCSLIVDASLQSSESPASLKRTYNGVVLGHDSASVGTETPEVDDRTYLLKRPRL
ncbi:kinase-like protein [Paxillus ammoniavirescens]|nr:kinase-like protein [Paxillus ammoniavirescens]